MLWFIEFVEKYLKKCEIAIYTKCELGEDEDPTVEELYNWLELESQDLTRWLFNTVLAKTVNKVSWTEFRQYLKEWGKQKEHVAEFFRQMELEEEADQILDDKVDSISGAVEKIQDFLDPSTVLSSTQQNLMNTSKEELVRLLMKAQYFQALEDQQQRETMQSVDVNESLDTT